MRHALAPLVAACACAASLALGGCVSPRAGLSSETGACAQVLPLAARTAGSGKPVTAQVLKGSRVTAVAKSLPSARRGPGPRKACLLVYQGSFPAAAGSRRYLVLLMRIRHPAVVASGRLDQLPRAVRANR